MAGLSTATTNLVLDWAMSTASVTRPTAWYLALYTVAPTDAGGGTEVSTGGYVRQAITFGAASSASMLSTNTVAFTAVGADYGTIVYVGIFDASTGGNFLWSGAMTVNRTVTDGQTLTFAIGDVVLSIT